MNDLATIYKQYPGKTGNGDDFLPLCVHLEDTATVMRYLCENRVSESVIHATELEKDDFFRVSDFLARVHDIGKYTPAFASKILANSPHRQEVLAQCGITIPNPKQSKVPHTIAGECLLRSYDCPEGVVAIVGAHHGKPSSLFEQTYCYDLCIEKNHADYYSCNADEEEIWKSMQEYIFNDALKKSKYKSTSDLPKLSHCAQVLLCGLLIHADWLASNTEYFPLFTSDEENDKNRAANALNKIDLTQVWRAELPENYDDKHFSSRFEFSPNPMQDKAISMAQALSQDGAIVIIEAQMGLGKTEAALAVAEILASKNGCGGLFFGLPTQATTNAVFSRLSAWAKRVSQHSTHSIRLAHEMANLNKEYRSFCPSQCVVDSDAESNESRLTAHSWFSGKKQALLADFVVGTVDTALMSALRQRHVMLRHLGLCGKVVVIDECHAYDAYMSRFLITMLKWLGAYKVPVVLLSATLPKEKKREMLQAYCTPFSSGNKFELPENEGYPLITCANEKEIRVESVDDNKPCVTINIEPLDDDAIVSSLSEMLSEGGCAGIIVNTVRRAQTIANELRTAFPDKHIFLHHAQFVADDRVKKEEEILSLIGKSSTPDKRNNVIIVGTQVLEQSLDIDFDYLITDLCPMDLLLQRMGRLHRHSRKRPAPLTEPICRVITEAEGNGSVNIYGEWLLNQTKKHLHEKVDIPCDIPTLVNDVYPEVPEENLDNPEWDDYQMQTGKKENKADSFRLNDPKKSRFESGNSIVGMLDDSIDGEKVAEASVRDGMQSVDVLVMCREDEDHIGYLPWSNDNKACLRCDSTPSNEEALKILTQRIRLPYALCVGKKFDEVVRALEDENNKYLSAWQESHWLRGEIILILDKDAKRELCGYQIKYDKEDGLKYERRDS